MAEQKLPKRSPRVVLWSSKLPRLLEVVPNAGTFGALLAKRLAGPFENLRRLTRFLVIGEVVEMKNRLTQTDIEEL